MKIEDVIKLLEDSLQQLHNDQTIRQFDVGTFTAWKENTRAILLNGLGDNAKIPLYQFDKATRFLPLPEGMIDPGWQREMFESRFNEEIPNVEKTLENIIWQLETFGTPHNTAKEKGTKPKIFIAHGPIASPLEKLKKFLISLDIQPLVIEEEPSEGRSTNEQVEFYLDESDCAIVFGTADDKELKDGKLYPRRNVCIEIGRFQERFPNRIIYLLEEGASLPTNVSEKVYSSFNQDSMEEAFIKTTLELSAFGLSKSSPIEKEQS